MLIFGRDHFLQVLEGSSLEVNNLYHRIVSDPRHTALRLLGYGSISRRDFAAWHMGHVDASLLGPAVVTRYGVSADFDPFALDRDRALGLLRSAAEVYTLRAG